MINNFTYNLYHIVYNHGQCSMHETGCYDTNDC
jgi:hypothetical protein